MFRFRSLSKNVLACALFCLAGCTGGLTATEQAVIHGGAGPIMRLCTIERRPDSLLLRRHARPMTAAVLTSPHYATLRRRMLATVTDPANPGVGIAAPQVGLSRCLIAVQRYDKEGEPFEFFLNPEIRLLDTTATRGVEGCLSVPPLWGTVARSPRLVLTYRDEWFRPRCDTVSGYTAVIFQHEVDHLNGILYIDRALPGSLFRDKTGR